MINIFACRATISTATTTAGILVRNWQQVHRYFSITFCLIHSRAQYSSKSRLSYTKLQCVERYDGKPRWQEVFVQSRMRGKSTTSTTTTVPTRVVKSPRTTTTDINHLRTQPSYHHREQLRTQDTNKRRDGANIEEAVGSAR